MKYIYLNILMLSYVLFSHKTRSCPSSNPSNVHIRRGKVDVEFNKNSCRLVHLYFHTRFHQNRAYPPNKSLIEFQDPTSFPGFFKLIFPPPKKNKFWKSRLLVVNTYKKWLPSQPPAARKKQLPRLQLQQPEKALLIHWHHPTESTRGWGLSGTMFCKGCI